MFQTAGQIDGPRHEIIDLPAQLPQLLGVITHSASTPALLQNTARSPETQDLDNNPWENPVGVGSGIAIGIEGGRVVFERE
jgi:hypothetical protein